VSSPVIPRFTPRVPKTENQIIDTILGATITPIINSLIVLPLDILAINTPTKGAQAIHHAQ